MKKKCIIRDFKQLRKLLRVMRITLIFCLLGIFQSFAVTTIGQNAKLKLKMENSSIEEILNKLEEETQFRFFYKSEDLDVAKTYSIDFNNRTVFEILDDFLPEANLSYEVFDTYIAIKIAGQITKDRNLLQQKKAVSGKVTDSSGLPLPGVTVVIKGITQGTITDADGNYSLANIPEDATLVFSFVGMKTQEIQVSGKSEINVTLSEESIGIEEVVAIGYGTMRKSDLTGSVASVKSVEITAYPTAGAIQSLQGRAAGVEIQSVNGEPGTPFKVRVRGATSINSSSDPLFVVDGFPGAAMPPSEDIASVEILKDASATAIYGSRGANGVFIITTKRGKPGKPRMEFNSSYSMQNEIGRFDMLNTSEYISYYNDAYPDKTMSPSPDFKDTDWQDVIYRDGGIQNYQLSFSGGSDDYKYYISGVIYDQQGVVIESDYKRYSITSNIDLKVTDYLKAGINLYGVSSNSNGSLTQERTGGSGTGVTSGAVIFQPYLGIYQDDGSYTISDGGDPFDNPYAIAKERTNERVNETLQGNFFAELQIVPDLTFKTTFGARMSSSRNGMYTPSALVQGKNVGGDATIEGRRSRSIISENYLTYTKNINDVHNLIFMGGYSYESYRSEYWKAQSQNFITDSFDYWFLGAGSNARTPQSRLVESELASFYGRLNYKLFNRYMLTFNARYDGSSRFAKNKKWAFFPSGAIAWNVAEESFMDNIAQISQLKLRGSYGVTGSQSIGAYQSLARLRTINNTTIGGKIVNAIAQNAVANNELSWESTAQVDIGFDLGLFDQRIYLTADYYKMKTSDLLFAMPLPEYTGYSSLLKNIGATENRGIEFSLTTVNITGKLNWTTDINFSRNRNKILELPDENDIFLARGPGHMISIGDSQILRVGEPMGQFYGFVFDGIYQQGETVSGGIDGNKGPGDEKFSDLNGDGSITGGDDRKIIGDPNPDFTWGFNNRLEYKGFDLNVFFQGIQGNEIYSFTLMELESMSGVGNQTTSALERWTPTNTNTDVPKASNSRSLISNSRHIYDGSYIRLKNISLGYELPKTLISRLGIDFARIYVSGQNILTITDYPGIDPEVSWRGASGADANMNIGLDYGSYPNAKTYTMGIQVKF